MANRKIENKDYLYLSAMLRAREAKMLSREKAERMIDAPSFEDAAKMLSDCGYPDMSEMNAKQVEATLSKCRDDVFSELARMAPDKELVDVFRIKYDYHNAKTLIKSEAAELDRKDLLSDGGRVVPAKLSDALVNEDYRGVPDKLGKAMAEAKSVLNRTANPQLADFVLDNAYFAELADIAQKLGSAFLKGYTETLIDSANLRTAVRTVRMQKSVDFLKTALVAGGGVDTARIIAASSSPETLATVYATSDFSKAAQLGAQACTGGRMTAFELECDNAVTEYMTRARLVAFGEAPVIAYLAAVENEITTVRMILTGRLAGIAPDTIRERLRDFYA